MKEIKALLGKELILEWRQKYALNGILLYLTSTIFICYLSFSLGSGQINAASWNALLWIILEICIIIKKTLAHHFESFYKS